MFKLTKVLIIFFFLVGMFAFPRLAKAQVVCADWICIQPRWCDADECEYAGWISQCYCASPPSSIVQCLPGSYPCNRPEQCCPMDVCGDGACNAGEDCSNCPGDCGACTGGGGGGSYCGDGTCDLDENCNTCADCQPCPVVSADVKANGSDANITVAAPYTVSWNSTNAVSCLLNTSLVDRAGSNPYTNSSGVYPYNLSCYGTDTQATDAVTVTVNCNLINADVKANGSDTTITTFNDYTIAWSSSFATGCTLNGSPVTLNSSQVVPATANGTYPYNLSCSNSACTDTDSVSVIVNLCGNGVCAGFENCATCAADCGVCPTAWWQVWGGNLFAGQASGDAIVSDIPSTATCVEPSCVSAISRRDRANSVKSDGLPVTGGGTINNNGQMTTYRDPEVSVLGMIPTRLYENYAYFYNKYSLGLTPSDDFTGSDGDALKPTFIDQEAYFHSGDLTIQSPWDVASGESYVVFVDGDLNIEDPADEGELIKVAQGGFLAFIVSGDINIAESVGHSVLTNTAGNLEGVYVTDGNINIASNGTADKRFVGEGSFVGWSGVGLARTYDELGVDNDYYPTETFVYRPDFVKNTPDKMKRSQMLWQETN